MRILFSLAASLCCLFSLAQDVSISGKIVDAYDKAPLEAASIAVKNSFAGTISNEEGVFQLSVPKSAEIRISFIGYKDLTINASAFTSENFPVQLQRDESMLEEVIVSTIPIKDLLKLLIETSQQRFNKPIELDTYYREFVKQNGKYTKFSDGLLEYHIAGSASNTTSDVIVAQSRAVEVEKPGEDEFDFDSLFGTDKAAENYYEFRFLRKGVVNDIKKYDFTLKRLTIDGKEMMKLVYEPKPERKELLSAGFVLYDPETNLIHEVTAKVPDSHKDYDKTINVLICRISILDWDMDVKYKLVGNNYLLAYNNRYAKIRVWKKNKWDYTLESRSDLLVTDFAKDARDYDKKAKFKGDLYASGNKYSHPFWKNTNAIVLTAEEERIIAELENAAGQ